MVIQGAEMTLPEHIARVLSPHLGAATADAVAHHLCAKHEVGDNYAARFACARVAGPTPVTVPVWRLTYGRDTAIRPQITPSSRK